LPEGRDKIRPVGLRTLLTLYSFTDSQMTKGTIGLRIKTDSGAQGTVTGVTYSNIVLSSISSYGIDIQQDYGNTGTATNGVKVSGITFSNITGSVSSSAMPLYIFCGSGSCSNFKFTGVKITGGKASKCNYPSSTCPSVS
jgi:polygalacturonase